MIEKRTQQFSLVQFRKDADDLNEGPRIEALSVLRCDGGVGRGRRVAGPGNVEMRHLSVKRRGMFGGELIPGFGSVVLPARFRCPSRPIRTTGAADRKADIIVQRTKVLLRDLGIAQIP